MTPITDERVLELARKSMAPVFYGWVPDDDDVLAFARALLAEAAGNEIGDHVLALERSPAAEGVRDAITKRITGHTNQGVNRDASAGQSHGAGGSESPASRGTDGAPALGATPVSSPEVERIPVGVVIELWPGRC